jgi:Transposase zinc-binding domain
MSRPPPRWPISSAPRELLSSNEIARIRWKHIKVLLAIARCRTAALGGHLDQYTRCGHRATISYNSCTQSPLPKMSDRGPGTLDRGTPPRASPDALRLCGLHTSSAACSTGCAVES